MMTKELEITIVQFGELRKLFQPLHDQLNHLEQKLDERSSHAEIKHYRNKELKLLFGLSSNTIIKYRNNGVIPYSKIGDIFLYPKNKIDKILLRNLQT